MSKRRGEPAKVLPKPQTKLTATAERQTLPGLALTDLAIWLGLIVSIFVVYAQVGRFDFINYDDDLYVYDNVHVQAGLSPANIKWAFTGVVSNNWMPVTLLSHMLDVQLFGVQSGMHHLVNVIFHALSAILLFMVLQRATGTRWPSAFVAFMFALHPMHVGSVAWIAERKDVLSAFFWFLALYCYIRYTERPGLGRYLVMAAWFCLGLMSKPMLVTFPFTLLLFDIWPLRRVRWPKIFWEKVPLIVLSTGASVATYFVQRSSGAVEAIPFAPRVENALISYVTYIGQMFWPARLAVFYPYPRSIPAWQAISAGAVIIGVSAIAIYTWRTRPSFSPYLATGWFWYLGTLVPVIGLVQVGMQSHADRYTYIPMVGLSVMLAWGAADIVRKWPWTKEPIAAAAVVFCVAWMALAREEAAHWQNSEVLFQRAIDVTEDNWVAQYNLGHYLMKMPGRNADAIDHFEAALRIKPDYAETSNNLGACLINAGRCGDASPHLEAALRAKPDLAEANNNLGACLVNSGRDGDAIAHFEAALRVKPDYADAHFNLALALAKIPSRAPEAVHEFEAGLHLNPDPTAHSNFGVLLMKLGRTEEAISHFETAVRVHPDYRNEHDLGTILLTIPGRQSEGISHLEAAQRIHRDPEVQNIIDREKEGQRSRGR